MISYRSLLLSTIVLNDMYAYVLEILSLAIARTIEVILVILVV